MKTWKGRVVYNRDRHYFRWCDVKRILEKVEPAELFITDTKNVLCFLRAWTKFTDYVLEFLLEILELATSFIVGDMEQLIFLGIKKITKLIPRLAEWVMKR